MIADVSAFASLFVILVFLGWYMIPAKVPAHLPTERES